MSERRVSERHIEVWLDNNRTVAREAGGALLTMEELAFLDLRDSRATEARLRELLREIEGKSFYCPSCGSFIGDGHKPDCRLAAEIEKDPDEPTA